MIAFASNLAQPASGVDSPELANISDRLAALLELLYQHYGIESLYIGAGSSLAILDHCLFADPLVMRDLDIFVCFGQEMTAETAHEMGRRLASAETGEFSAHDVRPRRRANPELPTEAAYNYNAGFGLFLIDKARQILDLTVFHSHQDMLLNGIMNVDKVRIKVSRKRSLVQQLSHLNDDTPLSLRQADVEDEFHGYHSWRSESAELINEFDVKRAPLQTTMRIIRTFAKFARPTISESTKQRLGTLMAANEPNSTAFYTVRGLIKLLADRHAAWELQLLREIGGIPKIGGIARQHLTKYFQLADRFGHQSTGVQQLRQAIREDLLRLEHEMKLQGAV
ncbi:MAG: hypothetical protein KDA87_21410 [Planctomycetales bacterium]|nr:hypothetical protein [Planctomycetales bacterium]